MAWIQKEVTLRARSRGFHLVTREVLAELPELRDISVGLLNIFIQHTSASLGINENADPDVRTDLEMGFSNIVPEDFPYVHTMEGPDDMPAHIKAAMIGSSLSIPITDGHLNLGTWQGIYLCEHRNHASGRHLVLTIQGQSR
ncbi:secondary thiamine-phosphate synthase enzyme YjbQ [Bremerella alba]|nr:secondary thiamine-phosphate synthase enzyme YjbQ [Bremerella alba]